MAIKYLHKETGETVNKELWRWCAVYEDGTKLDQFEVTADGAFFHRFAEIDQSRLAHFYLEHNDYPRIEVEVPEGGSIVHFYRNDILNAGTPAEERVRRWCIGYRKDKELVFMAAHDNGQIKLIKEQ